MFRELWFLYSRLRNRLLWSNDACYAAIPPFVKKQKSVGGRKKKTRKANKPKDRFRVITELTRDFEA
jgi:hypothetical protein